jgi:hypothetical protein
MTGDATIKFLGFTPGAEILGATQANFAVDRPTTHAKELSVLLNAPAAAYLAEALGREDTPEFREDAAREAGLAWIAHCLAHGHHLDSVTFLSRPLLESTPSILEALRSSQTPA